jgi:23S rRNA (cytidine1920-2'-O)/16S rRNA (cytidine1409-2'-O)-methyltransferase
MSGQSTRLDLALVERGLAETRSKAQALVLAGSVLVAGQVATRAGHRVSPQDRIELRQRARFASRGGEKLEHALREFGVSPTGKICADIGASTGGFTDCLLQAGAEKVYAIDVGYGQLDFALREDARVVVMERLNARYLERLPEPVSIVVIDVSFISLRLIFPVAYQLLDEVGECVALAKPQFEAGRGEVGRKGVVSDPEVHRRVLEHVVEYAESVQFRVSGLTRSPLKGPAGNVEFLLHLTKGDTREDRYDVKSAIDGLLEGT